MSAGAGELNYQKQILLFYSTGYSAEGPVSLKGCHYAPERAPGGANPLKHHSLVTLSPNTYRHVSDA